MNLSELQPSTIYSDKSRKTLSKLMTCHHMFVYKSSRLFRGSQEVFERPWAGPAVSRDHQQRDLQVVYSTLAVVAIPVTVYFLTSQRQALLPAFSKRKNISFLSLSVLYRVIY